jgi:hypothetical protein
MVSTGKTKAELLFDQLLGSWELVAYTFEVAAGQVRYPLGEDAVGSLIYTPQRRVSVNIMRSGRRLWASPVPVASRQAEAADAAAGYLAYSGSFTVDEAASAVEHHISVSLFPNWIGDTQRRLVHLNRDELVLESPAVSDGAGNSGAPRLRWRRVL